MTLWLMVALVVGQAEEAGSSSTAVVEERVVSPARGSVDGFWGLLEFGVGPQRLLGGFLSQTLVVAQQHGVIGYGARVGRVPVVISGALDWSLAVFPQVAAPEFGGFPTTRVVPGMSNLDLAVALPDVVNDRVATGIRLTPMLAVEAPVSPLAWGGMSRLTQFRLGGQAERRFNVLELAYRLEGKYAVYGAGCPPGACPGFQLVQSLQGEVWPIETVSVLGGVGVDLRWPVADGCVGNSCRSEADLLRVRLQASWRAPRLLVVSLEGQLRSSAFLTERAPINVATTHTIVGTLWFTFRSDQVLERNWIER